MNKQINNKQGVKLEKQLENMNIKEVLFIYIYKLKFSSY